MAEGQQENVAVCACCGQPIPRSLADLPPETAYDTEVLAKLHAKAIDPQRRKLFHSVFMQPVEGRILFSLLLIDLGLFDPALRTIRAVAMRDVAAHLLASTGMTDHAEWLAGWIEHQGNPVIQENLRQIGQRLDQYRQNQPPGTDELDPGPPGML